MWSDPAHGTNGTNGSATSTAPTAISGSGTPPPEGGCHCHLPAPPGREVRQMIDHHGQNISYPVMARRFEPMHSADDFPTPPWAARALFEYVLGDDGPSRRMSC